MLTPIKLKEMKKFILFFIFVLVTLKSVAHQPDLSTLVLVEKEPNSWVLQMTASLTAFQQEVQHHFSSTPYKTPQEFQEMVLQLIKNQLEITVGGDVEITLNKGVVQLGHETKVVFEVIGIPKTLEEITVKNTVFKDIYKSQSVLVLIKENINKKQFILNNANNHTVSLYVNDDTLVQKTVTNASLSPSVLFVVSVAFIAIVVLGLQAYRRRTLA